jgi:uncharacterized protein (DUF1810 family)
VADEFDLDRFVAAQNHDQTFERAVRELRNGRKQTHWMWFVFPQIAGLGQSPTSQRYAIASLEEAEQYMRHPILGPRLTECTGIMAALEGTAELILGYVDAQKLRSSMTLFAGVSADVPLFTQVIDRFFGGEPDPATLHLL